MKHKKLLLAFSIIALVACSSNSNLSLSSKDNSDSSSQESTTTSDSSSAGGITRTSSSNVASTSSTLPDSLCTKTVTFYNSIFTNSSLDEAPSQARFVEWFNGDDNLLNTIDYSGYAQINYIGNANDSDRFSTLILGSSSKAGKITFNFNNAIDSIKVVVQAYTKHYAYGNVDTYSTDTNATFSIDTIEYDLSLENGYLGPTENKTFEHSFTNNTRSFSISNKEANQRVFVHSMEIAYSI